MMITVSINGETCHIGEKVSLAQLITQRNLDHSYFAVAVNNEFIPKSAHAEFQLQEHDRIEIVVPMQGG